MKTVMDGEEGGGGGGGVKKLFPLHTGVVCDRQFRSLSFSLAETNLSPHQSIVMCWYI